MELEFLAYVATIGQTPLVLLIAALLFLAKEIGFRTGRRRSDAKAIEGAGVVVGSILALTAFVLALTLSAATNRLSERRATALTEANAIGTVWLQAERLGPQAEQLATLTRDYAKVRLEYQLADRRSAQIDEALERSAELNAAIWTEVSALLETRSDSVIASLMNATGTMFDTSTATRFAIENGLPVSMVRLMFALTLGAMFSLGWQLGLMDRPNYLLAGVLALFWATVLVHILDMGTARIGAFGAAKEPYLWVLEDMAHKG